MQWTTQLISVSDLMLVSGVDLATVLVAMSDKHDVPRLSSRLVAITWMASCGFLLVLGAATTFHLIVVGVEEVTGVAWINRWRRVFQLLASGLALHWFIYGLLNVAGKSLQDEGNGKSNSA
ncbi:hypothetical protein [Botrimarina hoheduenensis]|uniref:hypothetical protein n=1 Tax=Botrimarina hoheduenensis TaxID=2528000 RepID=UPI0011B512FF|nr:hypothetical protein [Botrimarina hoheduenensis]